MEKFSADPKHFPSGWPSQRRRLAFAHQRHETLINCVRPCGSHLVKPTWFGEVRPCKLDSRSQLGTSRGSSSRTNKAFKDVLLPQQWHLWQP